MRISDWSSDVCSSDLGHRPGRAAIAGTGLASGVLTGFAAMPGPPVVPFYLRRHLPPKVARASMLLIHFGTAIAGMIAALRVRFAPGRLFLLERNNLVSGTRVSIRIAHSDCPSIK